jgi:CubicO group peptidase (beta-lactamase class C family)
MLEMKLVLPVLVSLFLVFGCQSENEQPTSITKESQDDSVVIDAVQNSFLRIENGLRESLQIAGQPIATFSIESRLQHHNIPGVSIGIAHKGKVIFSQAYGFSDIALAKPMTTETLLLAGSISKPIAALRALQLHDEGKFLLDDNVNNYLTSWSLPDNEFTKNEKVTLRRILNHTAGLTVWGFPGYDYGDTIPSTIDVLNGKGNTDAVRVYKTPGESWQYSGGGYTIMQLTIADIEQEVFEKSLQVNVLNPLKMGNSTYENPLPEKYHSLAATGYRQNGDEVEGKWPIYPEMAAAGLWTTPSQLVQYGIEIQNITDNRRDGIIKYQTVIEMLTPGENDHGLGPVVNEHTFFHGGADEGFRARLVAWRDSPYVAVIMVNSDNGAIISEILMSIANEFSLPGYEPSVKNLIDMPISDMKKFVGHYDAGEFGTFEISLIDDGLVVFSEAFDYNSPLLPQGPTSFFESGTGVDLNFVFENESPEIVWRDMRGTRQKN